MRRTFVALGMWGVLCLATAAAQAQDPPGSEIKKFDVWLGEWVIEELGKDPESGKERRINGTARISRMGESFYVRDYRSEEGNAVVVMGYDPVRDSYFSELYGSDGTRSSSTITFGDQAFTDDWTLISPAGEKTQERCEVDLLPSKINFECKALHDGEWTVSRTGTGTRVK